MSADIQIVYRVGYCDFYQMGTEYDIGCHCCYADSTDCRYYLAERWETEDGQDVIPFGNCAHAHFEYRYKGWTGKKYEMEECRDPHNPHIDSMLVKLGNKEYDCVKVTLNGKIIFNEYDEEHEEEAGQ